MAIEGLCDDEKESNRYKISFFSAPNKQQLLDLSKMIGLTGAETYRLFQKELPIHIDNIPMVATYQIRKYFRSTNIAIIISPPIDQYHLFEDCWHM